MKKLIVVAGFVAAILFGSATAANAGVNVCYDVNINGNQQAACQTVDLPALPTAP